MLNKVRVRFAPSPTGPLHIGGLRTALYNYLFARQHKGAFVLRIEDTDRNRYVPGAENYIQETLEWCGITPDESPLHGGGFGPYRQSERSELYREHIDLLVAKGRAYYAFDSANSLEKHRKNHEEKGKTFIYNWHNRLKLDNSLALNKEEVNQRLAQNVPYVVRFKIYDPDHESEQYLVEDEIRGKISSDLSLLDDKILFKSDGMPTYHFANVVDDHLMKISHVIRGEEWLPSLPLHMRLYDALGWEAPKFAHLPLILKPSGKGKLSKRDGDKLGFPVFPLAWKTTSSSGYKEQGYLPEAVVNFLALLGWNPGTEEEIFEMDTLIKSFDLHKVHKGGARFDPEKNKWFNQQHIQMMPLEHWVDLCEKILESRGVNYDKNVLVSAAELIQNRVAFVHEIWDELNVFFEDPSTYDESSVKKAWKENTETVMESVVLGLEKTQLTDVNELKNLLSDIAEQQQIGMGKVMAPLRVCMVGSLKGPDLSKLILLVGAQTAIRRINLAISTLCK
jgi:glutamyl-tRNA synthetase